MYRISRLFWEVSASKGPNLTKRSRDNAVYKTESLTSTGRHQPEVGRAIPHLAEIRNRPDLTGHGHKFNDGQNKRSLAELGRNERPRPTKVGRAHPKFSRNQIDLVNIALSLSNPAQIRR